MDTKIVLWGKVYDMMVIDWLISAHEPVKKSL